jgi:hypothetical protein
MPTLSRPQLTESDWLAIWDRMYRDLFLNAGPILTALGFYTEHDLQTPEADLVRVITRDEDADYAR